MSLIEHAKREFELLGWPGNDIMQKAVCDNILAMLEVFANEGHSGSSASYTLGLFDKLARFQTIAPLTGKDDEWNDVSEISGITMFQNKRDSEVFKNDEGAYWIHGEIFRDEDGCTYTNGDSHVPVEFPWTRPEPEIIDVKNDVEM